MGSNFRENLAKIGRVQYGRASLEMENELSSSAHTLSIPYFPLLSHLSTYIRVWIHMSWNLRYSGIHLKRFFDIFTKLVSWGSSVWRICCWKTLMFVKPAISICHFKSTVSRLSKQTISYFRQQISELLVSNASLQDLYFDQTD